MNRRFVKYLLSISCIFVLNQITNAQDAVSVNYKWWEPSSATVSVIEGQGWADDTHVLFTRLPEKAKDLVPVNVWSLSKNSAGEYLNFKTSASSIVVRYVVAGPKAMDHMPATGVSGVDLYARDINGKWQWAKAKYKFGDTIQYQFDNLSLSGKEEEFRLYLPLYNSVTWMAIGVPSAETFTPLQKSNELPVVIYGT